jgi:SAM-dependent methyltransferase
LYIHLRAPRPLTTTLGCLAVTRRCNYCLMDEITKYNIHRWQALVKATALFTRPVLNLNPHSARRMIDSEARLGDVAEKVVLCLACGGGQQSVAFALLGAKVTVFDLSEAQLQRDREAAAHYRLSVETIQGEMRDLSCLRKESFDIVYHGYSLGFVPDAREVFQQVATVIRRGGIYHFNCANPFFIGLKGNDWNGEGYVLKLPYVDGAEIICEDQEWVYDRGASTGEQIPVPIEYRHRLSTIISGLVEQGFVILHVSDYSDLYPDQNAEPSLPPPALAKPRWPASGSPVANCRWPGYH